MSDEATGKSGKTWLYVVGVLVGVPTLYLLSTGPAILIMAKFPTLKIFGGLYAPVDHLYDHGPNWMHDALDAYFAVWGIHLH